MMEEKIEAILFIANRPLSVKKLVEVVGGDVEEVEVLLEKMVKKFAVKGSGLRIIRQGDEVQISTSPDVAEIVQQFLKDEATGELTKPALETLTIIAYRGPVTKAELEQIRGVNCTIILRNLMMRGLIVSKGDARDVLTTYSVTIDFLRFLGVDNVSALPDYERLRSHESLVSVLKKSHDA